MAMEAEALAGLQANFPRLIRLDRRLIQHGQRHGIPPNVSSWHYRGAATETQQDFSHLQSLIDGRCGSRRGG
jgi:hypothetical protein